MDETKNTHKGITPSGKWEERFVAFIDILGFKEHIEKKDDLQQQIVDILYIIKNSSSEKFDIQIGTNNGVYISLDIISFTDSILISAPLQHPKIDKGPREESYHHWIFCQFIQQISFFYKKILPYGIALRGGMSVGSVYYDPDNNIIMGKPIIEAINYESKLALYPRVIISDSLLTFFRQSAKDYILYFQLLRRDFDGFYFIDYLKEIFICRQEEKLELDIIEKIRNRVGGASRLRPPTPPYKRCRIRRFQLNV